MPRSLKRKAQETTSNKRQRVQEFKVCYAEAGTDGHEIGWYKASAEDGTGRKLTYGPAGVSTKISQRRGTTDNRRKRIKADAAVAHIYTERLVVDGPKAYTMDINRGELGTVSVEYGKGRAGANVLNVSTADVYKEGETMHMAKGGVGSISAEYDEVRAGASLFNVSAGVKDKGPEGSVVAAAELGSISFDSKVNNVAADVKAASSRSKVHVDRDGAEVGVGVEVGKASAKAGIFSGGVSLFKASAEVRGKTTEAGAMVRANLGSVSAGVGPLKAEIAVSADTGIRAGENGIEAKFLGTGFTLGRNTSVSIAGITLGFSF